MELVLFWIGATLVGAVVVYFVGGSALFLVSLCYLKDEERPKPSREDVEKREHISRWSV